MQQLLHLQEYDGEVPDVRIPPDEYANLQDTVQLDSETPENRASIGHFEGSSNLRFERSDSLVSGPHDVEVIDMHRESP